MTDENEGMAGDAPRSLNDGRLEIRLLRPIVTSDPVQLAAALTPVRESERDAVDAALRDMRTVAADNARGKTHRCLAYTFANLYAGAALACGGCPWCRQAGQRPYAHPIPVDLEIERSASPGAPAALASELRRLLGIRCRMSILWDGPRKISELEQFADLVAELVAAGVQQVLLPTGLLADDRWIRPLVERLAALAPMAHCFLPDTWILEPCDRPLFALATVAVYPPDDAAADRFHRALEQARHMQLRGQPLVRVVHRDIYLPSESGSFRDRVEGMELPADRLLARLREAQHVELF